MHFYHMGLKISIEMFFILLKHKIDSNVIRKVDDDPIKVFQLKRKPDPNPSGWLRVCQLSAFCIIAYFATFN